MEQPVRWFLRPRVALPVIAVVVLVVAVLTPERVAGRNGNPRLTTYSSEPQGAKLLYELSGRLGWNVSQSKSADLLTADAPAREIVALLDPVVPLRKTEVHALLEKVRAGGALLFVFDQGSSLADSLHVGRGPDGIAEAGSDSAACPQDRGVFQSLWPDDNMHLYAVTWRAPGPEQVVSFVPITLSNGGNVLRNRVAAMGFPLGAGRVVVAADADLFRNDVLRSCRYGVDVPVVRMLEYLRDGAAAPRDRITFDEYHQGFGAQSGTMRAITGYLRGTPSGRALLQVLAALLVLLAAASARTLVPAAITRLERRSPLEHVDALARAYSTVGATRTAASHLLRGVRRRFEHGTARGLGSESNAAFLDRVQRSSGGRADDVQLVRRALAESVPRRELVAVGAALDRIESSLTRT